MLTVLALSVPCSRRRAQVAEQELAARPLQASPEDNGAESEGTKLELTRQAYLRAQHNLVPPVSHFAQTVAF
jgi:hypothetical protein